MISFEYPTLAMPNASHPNLMWGDGHVGLAGVKWGIGRVGYDKNVCIWMNYICIYMYIYTHIYIYI